MQLSDLYEAAVPKIATPRYGARSFGVSLGHLSRQTEQDVKDDVINFDYLDDRRGHALRYRFIVGRNWHRFLHATMPQIEAAGWHLTVETKRGGNRWQLVFEPLTTARVPRGVFWHLSPSTNVASISRNGLVPRRSRHGIDYPQSRIYLLRRQQDAERMKAVFAQRDQEKVEYAVFKVDLRRAKGVPVHIDPELDAVAVYTTQPIPPQFVSLAP